MNSSKLHKVKSYIYDNRPRKLKNYVDRHEIDVTDVKLNRKRNLLHYCCKHGSTECLKYLLSKGLDGLIVDRDLNTPLHLALDHALTLERNGKHELCSESYSMMILPLIERFPGSLDMKNVDGDTCRRLLAELVRCRESGNSKASYSSDSSSDDDNDSNDGDNDVNDESTWRDKLAAEWQDEYQERWGKFEQDYTADVDDRERYDDWADRIRQQYYARKRAKEKAYWDTYHSDQKRKHSDKPLSENDHLDKAREKMRKKFEENKEKEKEMDIWKKRMKYEERYKQTLDDKSVTCLRYDDIPWPCKKGHNGDITVLLDGFDRSSGEYKKYLRDQKIRWHPDKFLQRFGKVLNPDEKETILQRVTSLSQILNKLDS
ncbi:Nuclear factor of kappa light polypeptide protein enhancer in B-cells inhibitor-like 1 [Mactra antiquata]